MIDRNFDPSTLITATREAFAPVIKAQQEGFKTLERLARLQYAVAGDVLESSLARVHATFAAATASELMWDTGLWILVIVIVGASAVSGLLLLCEDRLRRELDLRRWKRRSRQGRRRR